MEEINTIKKHNTKKNDTIYKTDIYADTAKNAMKNVSEFDSMIIEVNGEYLEKLTQADKMEYDILKDNMIKAETEKERQAIRDRMAEMKKERYEKDTENKTFYEKQQESHKNYTLKVLCSLAVAAGLVGVGCVYKKPLTNIVKSVITK